MKGGGCARLVCFAARETPLIEYSFRLGVLIGRDCRFRRSGKRLGRDVSLLGGFDRREKGGFGTEGL